MDLTAKNIYETGILFHHYANTAYPLTPGSLMQYKIRDEAEIKKLLMKDIGSMEQLSLYVHVPFCKQRCKFCEYTVLENTTDDLESEYVDLLLKEMDMYKGIIGDKEIVGYDLGGGTPSKLSSENLKKITEKLFTTFHFAKDTVCSVETTPVIAASEYEKIAYLYELGYRRISMGVQTVSERLLNSLGREGTTSIYERAVENIRKAGFTSFNIDLMYGFLHQNDEDFENTIKYAMSLGPEHITLYRNRYKGTKIEAESAGVSLYKAIRQYRLAYALLNEGGYKANPGKNTFSKVDGDYGTSDYLTKRVIDGVPYVGFGLGAQSFGMNYLAYNDGAATKKMDRYKEKIQNGAFPLQDIYALPEEETIAKMVSVAFYFGFVDLVSFAKRFGKDFTEIFKDEVEFVLAGGLMEQKGDRLMLTKRGADYINGIIPLFYSKRSKEELITLAGKMVKLGEGEKEFLSVYSQDAYEKPSVAADIVLFNEDETEVLLVKRGEHPFMNYYALPGGFVRKNETVEAAAARELQEETGVSNVNLQLVGTFSEPGRDPRGWMISIAYKGKVNKNEVSVVYGDDAIEATWMKLEELENIPVAFDHKEIIQKAFS
ncbi:MAG: NUDIX domain-containing protein [Lachnospiraceae bacterium]|nr:NUDIX domain-containing protein [Lachnospiraceae bacterium]